ncbi:hypothetical protein AAG906_019167 [Vitis piasezkii]|uniref:glutathione transferase n=1 Tax=Vitis vinifera TaxID=29760 RepID=A0A438D773_VITVI|nr:Glutathione S-transferase U17 [Vitis vinifera]
MATSDVKLLGAWPSPFALRVHIALNIKSIDYECLEENLLAKSQLLLQSNPVHKKVPVLIHHDKPICESLAIVQYIDEAWSSAPSILPSDPYDRAVARFWAAYIDDKWFPWLNGVANAQGAEAKKAALDQVREGLVVLEEAFGKCSKGKDFFSGDRIGYVDIALGCFLGWVYVAEKRNDVKLLVEDKMPGLAAWANKFCEDGAVKDVMPDKDELLEFANMILEARAKLNASSNN